MDSKRWLIVAASALALVASQGPINVFAAGVFLKPISQELGFGRGDIATAVGVSSLMTAVASPIFGRLIDRFGVRMPLIVSIVLFALATAAIALLPGSIRSLYGVFAATGFLAIGQTPGSYSKVVSAWFDAQRGLALGIVLAGVGVGTAVIPIICNNLIATFGWRGGYVGLAAVIMMIAFIPAVLFIREPVNDARYPAVNPELDLPGVSTGVAVRDRRFWFMTISFFFAVVAVNGTLVHVVPMLTDRGLPLREAVQIISTSGIALVIGRLFAGWIIDRVFAPYVAVFFLLCPAVGLLVLALQPVGIPPIVGVVLLGLGIGGETDLLSYMVSRYFGLRRFGSIYGWLFTAALLGNAFGSAALGWAFEITHDYTTTMLFYVVLLVIASALMFRMGPYAYPPVHSRVPTQLKARSAS
jgi:MFS family permease